MRYDSEAALRVLVAYDRNSDGLLSLAEFGELVHRMQGSAAVLTDPAASRSPVPEHARREHSYYYSKPAPDYPLPEVRVMRHGVNRDADPTAWSSDCQRPGDYAASPERGGVQGELGGDYTAPYAAQPEPGYYAPNSPELATRLRCAERGYAARPELASPSRPAPLPRDWLSPQVRV